MAATLDSINFSGASSFGLVCYNVVRCLHEGLIVTPQTPGRLHTWNSTEISCGWICVWKGKHEGY